MNKIIYIFLILLIASISLSPRLSVGVLSSGKSIDVRLEDIVLFFGLVALSLHFFISGKYKIKLAPLFWPIIAWVSFGFLSVLFNVLSGHIVLSTAFFYFLKEIEFLLLYFVVLFCASKLNENKRLMEYWLLLGGLNVFWLICVYIFNLKWSIFYGANAFMEPQGPFPSGGFFLLIFIIFFNLFLFYYNRLPISLGKKIAIFIICILPIFGIISSGSMASTMGLFASVVISLVLLLKDRMNLKRFIKTAVFAVIAIGILLTSICYLPVTKRVISFDKIKWEYTSNSPESRIGILKHKLSIVFSSVPNAIMGVGVNGENHSQYTRVIVERGFVGLALFLFLMWSILKKSYIGFNKNKNFEKGLFGGLLVSTIVMLIMSIPNDAFMVTKIAEVYWFFAAMALSQLLVSKQSEDGQLL